MAEEARLESVWSSKAAREFESRSLRKKSKKVRSSLLESDFFVAFCKAPPQAGRDVASREAAQANLGESEIFPKIPYLCKK